MKQSSRSSKDHSKSDHHAHGHDGGDHGHGHGPKPRTLLEQGKWRPYSKHISYKIKIPVLILMVAVWIIAYIAVSADKPHPPG